MAVRLVQLLDLILPVAAPAIRLGLGRATSPPTMPHVIAFGTMLDEKEEPERDAKGPVQAAEDHVQEVSQ